MVYTVELSFDAKNHSTVNTFCRSQREIALSYECESQYFMHDVIEKKNKIIKNDCIHVVHFSQHLPNKFIEFLKKIYKMNSVYIECIYSGDINYKFIYISGRYLKRMNKIDAKTLKDKYKTQKSDNSIELEILNIFRKI